MGVLTEPYPRYQPSRRVPKPCHELNAVHRAPLRRCRKRPKRSTRCIPSALYNQPLKTRHGLCENLGLTNGIIFRRFVRTTRGAQYIPRAAPCLRHQGSCLNKGSSVEFYALRRCGKDMWLVQWPKSLLLSGSMSPTSEV